MMFFGCLICWTLVVWLMRGFLIKFFSKIHFKDENRTQQIQKRLQANFIFHKKNKIHLYHRLPTFWIQWIEHFRRKKFQKQLLILIPQLSSMLRSGHSLERALAEAKNTLQPPMSEEIHFILKEMKLGATLDSCLERLVSRFHSENLLTLAHAILISRKLGTSLSQAMDHITENILEKEKLKSQIHSLTAQGKMQAYMAIAMPFFLMMAIQWISPGYFRPMFETWIGKCAMPYGLISMSIGLYWIHSIINKELL